MKIRIHYFINAEKTASHNLSFYYMFTLQNHAWHYTGQVQIRIRRQSDFFRRIAQQWTLTTAHLRRKKGIWIVLFTVPLKKESVKNKQTKKSILLLFITWYLSLCCTFLYLYSSIKFENVTVACDVSCVTLKGNFHLMNCWRADEEIWEDCSVNYTFPSLKKTRALGLKSVPARSLYTGLLWKMTWA